MLPSHNCIIITMFSFQGAFLNLSFKKLNEVAIACYFSQFLGGDYRDRTADLLLARQALSQLS